MIRYTDLIADTILAHGAGWAWRYYQGRMPRWMAEILMRHPAVARAMVARACYERLVERA